MVIGKHGQGAGKKKALYPCGDENKLPGQYTVVQVDYVFMTVSGRSLFVFRFALQRAAGCLQELAEGLVLSLRMFLGLRKIAHL